MRLVDELPKPKVEENVWSDADRLAYEREAKKSEEALARTLNED